MSQRYKQRIFWLIIIILILGVIIGLAYRYNHSGSKMSKLDKFTQCLVDQGAVFYGAFWCPHCQNQKALFGSSQSLLPYVECSTPDSQSQTAVCQAKNIAGYPTWEFKDQSRLSGELSLSQLAEKTGCLQPQ